MQVFPHYHENPSCLRHLCPDDTPHSCSPREISHYIYRGERDQFNLRTDNGYSEKKTDKQWEKYEGDFTLDNQHGNCVYRWLNDEGTTVYEGYVHCNNIHSYGRFSYPDGSFHEGLYRNNRRYGPGIHTEPNGRQNVGMWRNNKLIKLTIKMDGAVPTLAPTKHGKAKVERFKNVVEIKKSYQDKAKEIFLEMDASSEMLETSAVLYNILLKDNRSKIFHWHPYEAIFYRKSPENLQQTFAQTVLKTEAKLKMGRFRKKKMIQTKWKDIMQELERRKAAAKVLAMNATHLVAWNNSPTMEEMLLFCFKHSDHEDIITYNVADVMKAQRETFRAAGTHETLCVRFLKKCEIGDHWRVHDYLAFKCIDPDIADSEGNTGLMIASANDHLEVIDTVLDRGADINLCNDEGFTPLSLCMTRYLSLVNNIENWEKTFLSNPVELNYPENTLKWRHPGKEAEEFSKPPEYEDIFSTATEELEQGSRESFVSHNEETLLKISVVKQTIMKLLQRGANPLICNIPMPVLIMAVKCQDVEIVANVLQAIANQKDKPTDSQALEEALFAAIQLPATEEMVAICATLLQFGADANAKTECTSEDGKLYKLSQPTGEEEEEEEKEKCMKTVLHALATREDGVLYNEHLCAAVKLLLSYKADPNALFLGHSPLSAAIVKGNVGMVECLMSTKQVDPNQQLAEELGVPLTVLLNPRFAANLPTQDAIRMIDIVVQNGAELLTDLQVGGFSGTVVEFAHEQLETLKRFGNKDKRDKRGYHHVYQVLVDYITKLATQGVIRKTKAFLSFSLPSGSEISTETQRKKSSKRPRKRSRKGGSKDSLSSTKRKRKTKSLRPSTIPGFPAWLNADDLAHILSSIPEHERAKMTKEQIAKLLQMIPPGSKIDDPQKLQKFFSQYKETEGVEEISASKSRKSRKKGDENTETQSIKKSGRASRESKKSWNLLSAIKKARSQGSKIHDIVPDVKKTDVCFECGGTFDEDALQLCPECKQAKFCSAQCFWLARKKNTHKCKGDIFPNWKDDIVKAGAAGAGRSISRGGSVRMVKKRRSMKVMKEVASQTTKEDRQAALAKDQRGSTRMSKTRRSTRMSKKLSIKQLIL